MSWNFLLSHWTSMTIIAISIFFPIQYVTTLYADKLNQNGALPLLVESFTEKLIHELSNRKIDALSEGQAYFIKDKLKGLYTYLRQHPALMERRLYVGSVRPSTTYTNISFKRSASNNYYNHKKRDNKPFYNVHQSDQSSPKSAYYGYESTVKRYDDADNYDATPHAFAAFAQPVCPSRTEWRLLTRARDINETEVEVFQPRRGLGGQQWFYTVSCVDGHVLPGRACDNCCYGIDQQTWRSSCKTKKSYVMALIKTPYNHMFDWGWIQIDSSCSCSIVPQL
ncbi:unnamed protein product [Owenia fusiformis]|uniref:Uncharacterized protein n=1 Tax=Owenia fusiformis TaxID=6347 RepID=A0A8J1XK02_OWEFU|nr:unnamed protein product [Owenia fusiformis]